MNQVAFSALEEEFFAAGDQLAGESAESFADLDAGHRPASVWRQLWSWLRPGQRAASE